MSRSPSGRAARTWQRRVQGPSSAALVVFAVGAALSIAAAVWQARVNATTASSRFDMLAARTAEQVLARLRDYEHGLRGARGTVIAAGSEGLSRQRFRAYGESRDIAREFPGARGFGVVRRVAEAEEARFVAEMRRDGAADFAVRQLSPHAGDRYVIQYVEPFESNRAALGLDIASEARRREAAQVSMRSGAATLTAPITLVQAEGQPLRSFLLLLPIYADGTRAAAGPAEREAATFGWAYAPLVIDEVLRDFDFREGEFSISLRDLSAADAPAFFASPPGSTAVVAGLARRIELPVFGRSWQIDVQAHQLFVDSLNQRAPLGVAAVGLALTALLSFAMFLYTRSVEHALAVKAERARREAMAEDMAAARLTEQKLRASESFLDRTGRIAGVGGWEFDLRTQALTWTAQTCRIHEVDLDYQPDLTGALDFYPGEARAAIERAVALGAATGTEWDLELPFVTAKGREIWVRAAGAAEMEDGRCIRLAGAFQDITARKRAETLLGQERHLMTSLLESAPDQIYFKDLDSRFVRINPGLARRYGLDDPAQAVGKSDADFFSPEHARRTAALEHEIMTSGEPVLDLEEQELWPDRPPTWNLTTKMPMRDVHGQVVGLFGISRDITARKRIEAELKQTNERFAIASDSAGIGVWEFDVVSSRLGWDAWMYRLYGVARSAGSEPYDLWMGSLHPDDRERCEREIAMALRGEKEFDTEFRIVHPDGRVRHLRASARTLRDARGAALMLTGVSFDVTERRVAEAEAQRSSQLLRGAIEAIDEAFVLFDPQDRVLFCNDKCRELYATSADLIVPGRTFEEILRGGVARGQFPAAAGDGEAWIAERLEARRRGSSVLTTQLDDGRVLRDIDRRMPDGHTVGFRVDITELVRATEAAQAASRAKSQFLANMSHEIRSPMNAVIGLAYLLRQSPLSTEQAAFVDKMTVASKSLLGVINDVLDLSKIEAGELMLERTVFSPRRLIREQADLIGVSAQAKGIHFEVDIADDLPVALEGDVKHLGQILANLLSNAVKFTDRGSVTLRAACTHAAAGAATLTFSVRDTGIGVPAELHARLFAPFAQADDSITRRFGGTGLGLSIVKHLVDLMGGSIGLNSSPGIGTEFSVVLEFATAEAAALDHEAARDASHEQALAGLRVLIVDDSQINVDVARRILELQGARVGAAGNGLEALERLRAEPDGFDAVLMDVQMPVLDGVEATRRIRGELGLVDLPIVALTAGALSSERQRALAAGMNDFMVKPFAAGALTLCIRRHARPHGQASAGAAARPAEPAHAARDPWPEIAGIDTPDVQERLGGDVALFRRMLERLLVEAAELQVPGEGADAGAFAGHARAMHRLRGSAGMLGARSVQRLAGEIEAACAARDAGEAQRLAPGLAEALRRLRASTAAVAWPQGQPVRPERTAAAADRASVAELVALLREQNLSALERFDTHAAALRRLLGDGPYKIAHDHVENLRFHAAADALENSRP